ncbi:uncharacterized protein N7446_013754 [Penicillium canescens]|uniref:C2H2-type domain-containing protein n=1 Tax=Penicillium canescens TaxID=5083 RepID=A0AAD6N307_PENCN|nr:uncharacterized protein N7446_013754 [Penicillium canescens]KAJ6023394.1 hypothetical protein N7460_013789 [Penicillium canescens]KAJ6025333.1 hypothetical protein N7444_013012 [Penicillium canescens]KAJ6042688.1 hypothetical protein N7446_013754 [Penicillium canescens]
MEAESTASILPERLLHYCPAHQVLICTACHYAVQPTAIPRHLKDIHHIHSNKRRPFVTYAKSLKLRKPEEVRPPSAGEFPVPYLPLEQGWRCEAPGCNYLCASIKRMEAHWSAQHGRKGCLNRDWSAAPLQSFFRGNKLRYFTSTDSSTKLDGNMASMSRKRDHIRRIRKKHNLNKLDAEALGYYFSASYKSFVTNDQTERIWLDVVPDLAYNHLFLLQGILACTLLHMGYLNPTKRQIYTLHACAHQDSALPQFRHAIHHPDEKNCDAILSFAYLLIIYSFATDTQNTINSLLIVEDTYANSDETELILPQWLHFIRAGCSMLCDVWDRIENGPASALASAWDELGANKFEDKREDLPYLDYFKSLVPGDGSWSDESIEIYHSAANTLTESFALHGRAKRKSHVNPWNILGVWPVRLEVAFISLISERHPGALILLAYYCIILKDMENCWYFEGRPAKLLQSIADVLDAGWHPYIQDPIEIVMGLKT